MYILRYSFSVCVQGCSILLTLVGGGRPNHYSGYLNNHSTLLQALCLLFTMVKADKCYIFTHNLTTTNAILGRTLGMSCPHAKPFLKLLNNIWVYNLVIRVCCTLDTILLSAKRTIYVQQIRWAAVQDTATQELVVIVLKNSMIMLWHKGTYAMHRITNYVPSQMRCL